MLPMRREIKPSIVFVTYFSSLYNGAVYFTGYKPTPLVCIKKGYPFKKTIKQHGELEHHLITSYVPLKNIFWSWPGRTGEKQNIVPALRAGAAW